MEIRAYPLALRREIRSGAGFRRKAGPPGRLCFLAWFLLFIWPGNAPGGESFLPQVLPKAVKPGGVCLVSVSGPPSLRPLEAEFRGGKFPLPFEERKGRYEALMGIDLNTPPGKYRIDVAGTEGGKDRKKSLWIKVEKVEFRTQELRLPSSMVELDAETAARVDREDKRVKDLFGTSREERYWKGAFLRPVPGEVTTPFGLRRKINGRTRNPHTGIDLRGEEGAPVGASNEGVVVLADHFFFPGKAVFLDHGWGVYSMYFHLSEIAAGEGDRLKKGAVLGRVGSTGRSSGPHLHFGVVIRGARVDPLELFTVTKTAGG